MLRVCSLTVTGIVMSEAARREILPSNSARALIEPLSHQTAPQRDTKINTQSASDCNSVCRDTAKYSNIGTRGGLGTIFSWILPKTMRPENG